MYTKSYIIKKYPFILVNKQTFNATVTTSFNAILHLGVCPVLCSGQGEYVNGECKCRPGWKGKECHIRYEDCEVSQPGSKVRFRDPGVVTALILHIC